MKHKKIIVTLVAIVLGLVVLGLVKELVLNKPKEDPEEITKNIVEFIQKNNQTDEDRNRVAGYYKESLKDKFRETIDTEVTDQASDGAEDLVVSIKEINIDKDTANSTIEIQVLMFQMPIQFKFIKEGNFLIGYKWMINDIKGINGYDGQEKKESSAKTGEKVSIGERFSIKVSSPLDYIPADEYETPEDGMKFVVVEVEYFNESDKSGEVDTSYLTLRDSSGHSYEKTYLSTKKPDISSGTAVTPKTNLKGFVTYQIPKNAIIQSAVYSNNYVTATINY